MTQKNTHYGEFMLEQGSIDKAKKFFRMSAEKGEDEGISKLRELDGIDV